jgi:hypothetical protein
MSGKMLFRRSRDSRPVVGAGAAPRTSQIFDTRVFVLGMTVIAVAVASVNVIDVITSVHNEPQWGVLAPVVWEGTSWLSLLVATLIPWFLLRTVPLGARPVWRTVLVYAAAAPLYSIVHVGGFVALRALIYWAAGGRYDFGPVVSEFAYEASKDVFGYVGAIGAFWLAAHLLNRAPAPSNEARLFDIRDGARLLRVPVDDILAITSAGNYVEFLLRDGRRPLMRKPLSSMETELAAKGFVRTHRSWLVNAMQVTGLKPEGSGDYEVEVGSVSVPLSRRFPEALAKLRAG